jgi:hypothetical protein
MGRLLAGDHLAEVGDVLFDSGDALRPGGHALVGYAGSILSFGFGEGVEGVLELLLKRGAGHRGRVSLAHLRVRVDGDCRWLDVRLRPRRLWGDGSLGGRTPAGVFGELDLDLRFVGLRGAGLDWCFRGVDCQLWGLLACDSPLTC